MADTKVCTRCKRELPATVVYYHKNKESKDGLRTICKECKGAKFRITANSVDNPEKERRCIKCNNVFPKTKEYFNISTGNNFASYCKECSYSYQKIRIAVNKENRKSKLCSCCRKTFPMNDEYFFYVNEEKTVLSRYCRECSEKRTQKKGYNPEIERRCYNCNKLFPKTEQYFDYANEEHTRFSLQCKMCISKRKEKQQKNRIL